ncbi:MAG: hypothetical protein WBR15_05440 [Gammaproteobacteria bacterium]
MEITLFIPDLVSLCADSAIQQRLPALEILFARARTQAVLDNNAILAEIFGIRAEEFFVAPFMRLADTRQRDRGFYFRADPVHLAPDRDQLVMLPLQMLQVQTEEAGALAETFNRTYEADGYLLETPEPERWYLRCPAPLSCMTHAPARVTAQPVFDFMPAGKDGTRLRQLMNEVQMLFYEHPVNQVREAAGKPAINSLWFWGGGCLPETPVKGPEKVVTNIPLVTGLTWFNGSRCGSWPAQLDFSADTGKTLIGINLAMEMEVTRLEEQLAVPLLRGLRQGDISEVIAYPGNGYSYGVVPSGLRQFWRRRRPLSEILQAS